MYIINCGLGRGGSGALFLKSAYAGAEAGRAAYALQNSPVTLR